jgi:hypothetical protein
LPRQTAVSTGAAGAVVQPSASRVGLASPPQEESATAPNSNVNAANGPLGVGLMSYPSGSGAAGGTGVITVRRATLKVIRHALKRS